MDGVEASFCAEQIEMNVKGNDGNYIEIGGLVEFIFGMFMSKILVFFE
ncbi:TPA: hypothetical protein ACTXXA_001740 [Legionella anisa]